MGSQSQGVTAARGAAPWRIGLPASWACLGCRPRSRPAVAPVAGKSCCQGDPSGGGAAMAGSGNVAPILPVHAGAGQQQDDSAIAAAQPACRSRSSASQPPDALPDPGRRACRLLTGRRHRRNGPAPARQGGPARCVLQDPHGRCRPASGQTIPQRDRRQVWVRERAAPASSSAWRVSSNTVWAMAALLPSEVMPSLPNSDRQPSRWKMLPRSRAGS